MRQPTTIAPGPRAARPGPSAPDARRRQIVIAAVVVIVAVLVLRACAGHENRYEKVARGFTQAIQNNDYAAAVKYQNAETAAEMGRGRLGHAADVLQPLGKIQSVKENTPVGAGERVHEFDVRFKGGLVHERIKFDPQDKIVRFSYQKVPQA